MKTIIISIAILSIFCSNNVYGQTETYPIKLLARSYQDSIVLRWNVSHVNAWEHTIRNGYQIERMELDDESNEVEVDFQPMFTAPMKPWTEAEFRARTFPGDSMTALAYKCLYHPSKETRETGDLVRQMSMVSADQKGRFTMGLLAADLSPKAAMAQGVRWTDKNVTLGKKYIYRVFSPSEEGHIKTDTAYFILTLDDVYTEGPMTRPEAYPADRYISVRWLTESRFTAYFMERSTDLKNWEATHNGPIVPWNNRRGEMIDHITMSDSLPANGLRYHYRIRGINAFGEKSPWSDHISAQGIEGFTIEQPRILTAENNLGVQVDLTWQVDNSMPIEGIYVTHADNGFSENFLPIHEDILPSTISSYTHLRGVEHESNFYKLIVVYENGQVYSSLPKYCIVSDQAPPHKPGGLTGSIDDNGVVTLEWNNNLDPDLTGYFVLMANQDDHEFVNLTPYVIQETSFKDTITLSTLTEEVYYKIQAKDESGKISEFSDALMLKRPDIIPPSPPVILDYQVQDSTLFLTWYPSTSKDMVAHMLVMRSNGSEWRDVEKIMDLDRKIETTIPEEGMSEYALMSIDDAGLRSEPCFPIGVKRIVQSGRIDVDQFLASLSDGVVHLKWTIENNQPGKFLLYRGVDNGPMRRYKTLDGSSRSFTDNNVQEGRDYVYEIQFRGSSGKKSAWKKENIKVQ